MPLTDAEGTALHMSIITEDYDTFANLVDQMTGEEIDDFWLESPEAD